MIKRVLAVEPIHQVGLDLLRARRDVSLEVLERADPASLAAAMAGTHGIIVRVAPLSDDLLARAEALKIVSKHGVGCDNIAVDHLTARGIPVAIAADANALSVAEHVLMMLLALAKKASAYDRLTRAGRFAERDSLRAVELSGKTILIVGFGRIGKRVARLCRAFGMRVIVADIAMDWPTANELGYEPVEDFRPYLDTASFLTVHVPLNPDTRGLVGADELAALPEGSFIINCARGGIVDEAAVTAALASGRLAGAGFDVFDQEPPPEEHPLFGFSNVILSPHSAAATEDAVRRMATAAAQNVLDCFDGTLDRRMIFNEALIVPTLTVR